VTHPRQDMPWRIFLKAETKTSDVQGWDETRRNGHCPQKQTNVAVSERVTRKKHSFHDTGQPSSPRQTPGKPQNSQA